MIVPTAALAELGVREALLVAWMQPPASLLPGLLAAAFLVWVVNLGLPALIGGACNFSGAMDEGLLLLGAVAAACWLAYAGFAWRVGKRLKAAERTVPSTEVSGELTVLIPCRNEAQALPYLLSDLRAQSHPVRIVVIDDGSADGTCGAADAAGVECIPAVGSGKKAALATGFKHAQTAWFATVDADVRLGPDWARNVLAVAAHKNAACVLGLSLIHI